VSSPTPNPRGSLSRERVLDAAERVAARDGFGALSMRRVAAELGAAPMALYKHVATKDDLVDGVLDRVLLRFAFEPDPGRPWREELARWARAHRDLLLANPDAVPQLVNRPNPGLGATRIGELAFAILARAGFDPPQAVNAFAALLSLNYGWASFAAARRLGAAGEVGEQVVALPAEAFPHTAAVAGEFADYDAPERYDWALERLLDGLEAATAR
jgi:AcrR family transcriptional regulator